MWVRGLKQRTEVHIQVSYKSHPMWVRGLKLQMTITSFQCRSVAPYVGAWIETSLNKD